MKSLLKSLGIMLATALLIFTASCGGGDSSGKSDAPQLDSALFGR